MLRSWFFVHKRLHAGFNRVLHLLHHLFCIGRIHWVPVVWIEVPPVLVDQALSLWTELDVD